MQNTRSLSLVASLSLVSLILGGCAFHTYSVTKERADQDLSSGNRGFNQGSSDRDATRKTTRTYRVLEVEMLPLKKSVQREKRAKSSAAVEAPAAVEQTSMESVEETAAAPAVTMEPYTVLSNDTLQKIAKKFYGSSSRWKKIFDANKAVLKAPDRIYPGQVLQIPVESAASQSPAQPVSEEKQAPYLK